MHYFIATILCYSANDGDITEPRSPYFYSPLVGTSDGIDLVIHLLLVKFIYFPAAVFTDEKIININRIIDLFLYNWRINELFKYWNVLLNLFILNFFYLRFEVSCAVCSGARKRCLLIFPLRSFPQYVVY